jgi:hypothetical protein
MFAILRWLLVPFVGVLGCWAGFALAIALHGAFTWLCPAELLVSGMCIARWFHAAEAVSFCAGASIGAVLAVLLPSLVAPARQGIVAAVAFACGAAYAASFVVLVGGSVLLYVACALAAGAVTSRWCWVREKARGRTRPSSGQTQATLESAAHFKR